MNATQGLGWLVVLWACSYRAPRASSSPQPLALPPSDDAPAPSTDDDLLWARYVGDPARPGPRLGAFSKSPRQLTPFERWALEPYLLTAQLDKIIATQSDGTRPDWSRARLAAIAVELSGDDNLGDRVRRGLLARATAFYGKGKPQ